MHTFMSKHTYININKNRSSSFVTYIYYGSYINTHLLLLSLDFSLLRFHWFFFLLLLLPLHPTRITRSRQQPVAAAVPRRANCEDGEARHHPRVEHLRRRR